MPCQLVDNLADLSMLLRKQQQPWPKWAVEIDEARKIIEVLEMPLKELLAAEAKKLADAVQAAKDASAAELKTLTDAGKIVSDVDAAKLKAGGSVIDAADTQALAAGLAADGLGPDGLPLPPKAPTA